jgi:prephenate dehydrogenase
MIERISIVGTGLLGASTGLALRAHGFTGEIVGWDRDAAALETALRIGALTSVAQEPLSAAKEADLILLGGPVLAIVDWMGRLAEVLSPHQLLTDVGSTKQQIVEAAAQHYNRPGRAAFLPGHPMAGKEVSGAEYADAELFRGAVWLFTPTAPFTPETRAAAAATEFRALVEGWLSHARNECGAARRVAGLGQSSASVPRDGTQRSARRRVRRRPGVARHWRPCTARDDAAWLKSILHVA